MSGRRVVLVLVAAIAVLGGGCRGGGDRYEFFLVGTVVYRCEKATGACVAGKAGEAKTYAVLPPEGEVLEAWAAEEGLVVGRREGEGR